MICQQCGREAGPDAKYCVDCGSPLELRCPGCQTPYDPGSRFCSLCGRSLSEVASSDSEDQPRQPELSESLPEHRKTELQPKIEGRFQDDAKSYSCPRCRQRNAFDAEYCFACGLPLEDPADIVKTSSSSVGMASEEPAGFFVRLIAYLIDNVLAIVCASFVVGLFTSPDELSDFDSETVGSILIFLGVWVGYFALLVATRATTVGKSFFGLYVVRSEGSRVGLVRAVFRSVSLLLVLAVAYGTVLGVFLLLIPFVRTLHDHICDTKVVQRRRQKS